MSAEVGIFAMAIVDGIMSRDDDFIKSVLFLDGSTQAELDIFSVVLGLDLGDYALQGQNASPVGLSVFAAPCVIPLLLWGSKFV